jgi:glycosyl transferase, family 25
MQQRVRNVRGFVIHLARATQRKAQVARIGQSCPVPCEVVNATDGRMMSQAELEAHRPNLLSPTYPFKLGRPEIATFLSHRVCWQRIVDEDLDAGLVFEDDVEIDPVAFDGALSLVLENFTQQDYVRFSVRDREKPDVVLASSAFATLFRPAAIGLGAVCQLVGRDAAVRLLAATKTFDRPIDTFLQMSWQHGVPMLSVRPSGVAEISQTLGGSLINTGSKTLYGKLHHEVMRVIYRFKISLRSGLKGHN